MNDPVGISMDAVVTAAFQNFVYLGAGEVAIVVQVNVSSWPSFPTSEPYVRCVAA